MKFVCDNCQAQYMIADEKVGGRGVKVKCKKCGNTIVVRPPEANGDANKGDGKSARSNSSTKIPSVGAGKGARTLSSSVLESVPGTNPAAAEKSGSAAPKRPPPDDDATQMISNAATNGARSPSKEPPTQPVPVEDHNVPTSLDGPVLAKLPATPAFAEEKATIPAMAVPSALREPESNVATVLANSEDLKAAVEKHRSTPANDVAAPAPAAPAAAAASGAAAANGELENELAGAFDGLFGADGGDNPDRKPTRVYSADQLDLARLQADAVKAQAAKPGKTNGNANGNSMVRGAPVQEPAKAEKAAVEWYAAIQDEQRGPMPLADMENHWIKGDIDRESLVWRTGMPDWIPLKEVKDLKYLMDVAPQKKATSTPPRASTSSLPQQAQGGGMGGLSGVGLLPAQDDSSEEGWRPRGMTSVYKAATAAEASVAKSNAPEPAMEAPEPANDSNWMPGAASALASLVDDELSSMKAGKSKPPKAAGKPHKADEPAFKPPPAEDDSIEGHLPSLMGASGISLPPLSLPPVAADSGQHSTRQQTSLPTPLSASMGSSGGATSLPFAPARGGGGDNNTLLKVVAGVGALALVGCFVLGAIYITGGMGKTDNPQLAANTPPPANPPAGTGQPATTTPPPANTAGGNTTTTPAGTTATPANTTTPPAGQTTTTPPAGQRPKDDRAAAAAEDKGRRNPPRNEKAEKQDRKEKEKPEKAEKQEKKFAAVADDPPPREREREREEPKKPVKAAKKDDCDEILYPEGCDTKAKKGGSSAAVAAKETLSKTDILAVVKANKGDISKCVTDQKKKDASKAEGVLVMTWAIRKDGKTSAVSVVTPEFADLFLGKCVTRAIQGWKFDAYSGDEMKPFKFPFPLDKF